MLRLRFNLLPLGAFLYMMVATLFPSYWSILLTGQSILFQAAFHPILSISILFTTVFLFILLILFLLFVIHSIGSIKVHPIRIPSSYPSTRGLNPRGYPV